MKNGNEEAQHHLVGNNNNKSAGDYRILLLHHFCVHNKIVYQTIAYLRFARTHLSQIDPHVELLKGFK